MTVTVQEAMMNIQELLDSEEKSKCLYFLNLARFEKEFEEHWDSS